MILFLAAVLPTLFWDKGPETAQSLRQAGHVQIAVAAGQLDAWKGVSGITAEAADVEGREKLMPPRVDNRANQGSASRSPWIDTNGAALLRKPQGKFYYDVPGPQAAVAAAEAFAYGIAATIRTDAAGLQPLAQMFEFLRGLNRDPLPGIADIGFIDDGSAAAGEVMELMIRNNLQFKPIASADKNLKVNVRLGTPEYSLEDAQNPNVMAQKIRTKLTDEKRSLRVYGTYIVVGRLTGSGGRARVHLLNYGGVARKVIGVRVRVLGRYAKSQLANAGLPGQQLLDYTLESNATEFTLPELQTYAVVDLSR